MARRKPTAKEPSAQTTLPKCPTGIVGLDEITLGGLPRGRTSLVCGGAGSGKTLFAMQFLVSGATRFNEPGVIMTFEETADDLVKNVASLGFDLNELVAKKKLAIDHVRIERAEIEETGEYDLEGLFVRLAYAINTIGAKRVVIDTIEAIFGSLSSEGVLRAELRRLFGWLKDRGVTAIVTGERGTATLTRQGLEEYVSDCVILLGHEVEEQISTRRLRIVKYRGSTHGTNEYPFLIDEGGLSVLPITSVGLDSPAPTERVSSGINRLDTMMGGKGYYRGSSILISGTAGTGKTSIAAMFAAEACRRGERTMFFSFEESRQQIIRNMRSIGCDLQPFVDNGLLRFKVERSTTYGLEMHLAMIHKLIAEFKPKALVFDPISNLMAIGSKNLVQSMLTRLLDYLKMNKITTVFTSLTYGGSATEETDIGISSLIDTWLLLRDVESQGERNRVLYLLKSRGMAHSNQVREFRLSSNGIDLLDVYIGPSGVLTGSARMQQEARDKAAELENRQARDRCRREIERKRKALEKQLQEINIQLENEQQELTFLNREESGVERTIAENRVEMARIRHSDKPAKSRDKIPAKGRK